MTSPDQIPTFGGVVGDDVLDGPDGATEVVGSDGAGDAFSELAAALQKEVVREDVRLEVPGRPGIVLTFGTIVPAPTLKAWQKKNKDRHSETGIDEVRLMATVIANQCVGVAINGQAASGSDGEPLSFRHRDLWAMLNASSALETVLAMYGGVKGHPSILAAGDEILKSAGYGEDAIRAEDPTTLR